MDAASAGQRNGPAYFLTLRTPSASRLQQSHPEHQIPERPGVRSVVAVDRGVSKHLDPKVHGRFGLLDRRGVVFLVPLNHPGLLGDETGDQFGP